MKVKSILALHLFAVLCFFSCIQPFDIFSPDEDIFIPKGCGYFSMKIADNSAARDILPSPATLSGMYFFLEFTGQSPGTAVIEDGFVYNESDYILILPNGTYNLDVRVYLDEDDYENNELPVFFGLLEDIKIEENKGVSRTIILSPFVDGEENGRFEWDITSFPADAASAVMTVYNFATGAPVSGLTNYNLIASPQGGVDYLPSGYYRVLVALKKDNNHQEYVHREALHVYQNMTSAFTKDFSAVAFNELPGTVYVNKSGVFQGNYINLDEAFNSITDAGTYTVTVKTDQVIAPLSRIITGNITLIADNPSDPAEITLSSAGYLFDVIDGGTLILDDGIILKGINNNNNALVRTGGSFVMKNGSVITGNTNSGNGGAVYIYDGDFTMEGGIISGNTANNGGGVYGTPDGNFFKTGGIIYGNDGGANSNTAVSGNAVYYDSAPSKIKTITASAAVDMDSGVFGVPGGWDPISLSGSVSITGTPQTGQTLTANTVSLGGSGAVSYQWKRGGADITGEVNSTYVLSAADEGQSITVTVTRADNTGSVTSAEVTVDIQSGGLNISFAPELLIPDVNNNVGAVISQSGTGYPTSLTLEITNTNVTYTNPRWYYSGELIGTSLTLTLEAFMYSVGNKYITLHVEANGVPYSRIIMFTVTN